MFQIFKKILKQILPEELIKVINKQRTKLRFKNSKNNKAIFTKIYKEKLWGDSGNAFNSGSGSDYANSQSYINLINNFLDEKNIKIIVDLGCGDYRVASKFNLKERAYIGCDIVDDLIKRNNKIFSNKNISFICLDVIEDEIPKGDLLLIRQVLQHLSNDDISNLIKKIKIRKAFKYIIVTDELPISNVHKINPDVLKGATRIENNGGLYLEKEPFNIKVKVLLDRVTSDDNLRLRSVLLEI